MSTCPFQIGDRVCQLPSVDPFETEATVTALTERGFDYRYDHPIPFGRATDGAVAHGGTCFPEGYPYWRKVS